MSSIVNNTEQALVFQYQGGEVALTPRVMIVLTDKELEEIKKSDFIGRLIESGLIVLHDNDTHKVKEELFVDTVAETAARGTEEIKTVNEGSTVVTTESGERAATVHARQRATRSGAVSV